MDVDQAGLEVLPRDECLRLLATAGIGRVGFHSQALPVILPVAFAVDGRDIVIRIRAGSQLDDATHDAVIAFEADGVDPGKGTGWSVAVTGVTEEITDPVELQRVEGLGLGDWVGDAAGRYVRISTKMVSGRRGEARATGIEGRTDPPADDTQAGASLAETHTSVLFFVGDRVYKLKKSVDLGFLDFRTPAARAEACNREAALNRRLAPEVYLGVADLVGPDEAICDHLVVMRRMPEGRRLSTLVRAGEAVDDHLGALADLLARFHRGAERSTSIDAVATRDADRRRWESNAAQMAPFSGQLFDPELADEVMGSARRFLAGREPLFERRIAEGRICDGHGDLLAADIFCLDDGPRVLDCLEFDDRLRFGDVLADVAFLAMDLERLGRPDLAERFLHLYRAAADDAWPDSLAHHYIAYRAQVRAKVACLRWAQGHGPSGSVAEGLLRLCLDHLGQAQVKLVVVGGPPGTGKSTVAQAVAGPLGALVLRSDEVRKEMAGLDPTAHAPAGLDEGIYQPSMTDATYAELLVRARSCLELGRPVVLDASWRHPMWRRAATGLAEEAAADLVELRCVAPPDVRVDRVERRLATTDDPSDISAALARVMADTTVGWTTATELDTSGDPALAVARALASVGARSESGDP